MQSPSQTSATASIQTGSSQQAKGATPFGWRSRAGLCGLSTSRTWRLRRRGAWPLARKVHEAIDFREADLRTQALDLHRFDLVALVHLQIPQAGLLPILLRAARAKRL
jgi:hypothetical protein